MLSIQGYCTLLGKLRNKVNSIEHFSKKLSVFEFSGICLGFQYFSTSKNSPAFIKSEKQSSLAHNKSMKELSEILPGTFVTKTFGMISFGAAIVKDSEKVDCKLSHAALWFSAEETFTKIVPFSVTLVLFTGMHSRACFNFPFKSSTL